MVLGLSALTGACMIGPDYKPASAPVAKVWMEGNKASVDTGRQEYRDWWSVFNDPALSRLIDVAYRQNLTLMTAGVRVLEARAQLGVAIGEFFPQQQSLGASVSYNRLPISVPYHLSATLTGRMHSAHKPDGNWTSGESYVEESRRPTTRSWLR